MEKQRKLRKRRDLVRVAIKRLNSDCYIEETRGCTGVLCTVASAGCGGLPEMIIDGYPSQASGRFNLALWLMQFMHDPLSDLPLERMEMEGRGGFGFQVGAEEARTTIWIWDMLVEEMRGVGVDVEPTTA